MAPAAGRGGSLAPLRMSNPPTPPALQLFCLYCCRIYGQRLPARADRSPHRGGLPRPALGGPRDQMRHIFRGIGGAVDTRAAVDPVIERLVSRTASPPIAPKQPASPAGHPVCASLRRDSREGGGGCVFVVVGSGRFAWRPGIRWALDRRLLWVH